MATIRLSGSVLLDANGDEDINLIPGASYALGFGGAFGGGSVAPSFVDGEDNEVPVPEPGKRTGVTNPATMAEAGILEVRALTPVLRLALTGATAPEINVTITRLNEEDASL
jgi:hypothetical protein